MASGAFDVIDRPFRALLAFVLNKEHFPFTILAAEAISDRRINKIKRDHHAASPRRITFTPP
jgi:hypothetical protein